MHFGEDHGCKLKVAELLGQRFLEEIQIGGRRPFNNFISSLHFLVLLRAKLFSNAGYAAKLHKKYLKIVLLLYNLHNLASDEKNVF